jgi:hypothetical protein
VSFAKQIIGVALLASLVGCASTVDYQTDSASGSDRVQEVRPDIFLIVAKSGFYVPDTEPPWMAVDKLISKAFGQGPGAANKRWEARASEVCGSEGYTPYKIATFSYAANTGPWPRSIAVKSAYIVCNRKKYSEADIKAMFPDW